MSKLSILTIVIVAFLTSHSFAQDNAKQKKGGKMLARNVLRPFAKAKLTDEQKEKARKLISEKSEELKKLQNAVNEVVGDKRKAQGEARKKSERAGTQRQKSV